MGSGRLYQAGENVDDDLEVAVRIRSTWSAFEGAKDVVREWKIGSELMLYQPISAGLS